MKVLGLVWVGVRTGEFDRTLEFFRDVLGVPLSEVSEGVGWSQMPNSSRLEIFGPDDRDHTHFTTGPVPEFLVEDLVAAADELRAAGVELLGEVGGRPRRDGSISARPTAMSMALRRAIRTGGSSRPRGPTG